jgi:hypothetical protein
MQIKTVSRALLIVAILFWSCALFAQQANFKGGIEGGIMGTQVDGDTLGGYDKAGLRVGGFIEREITKDIGMQFGILYVQKGAKGEKNPDKLSSYYESNLHYIDMPITGRYYHTSGIIGEAGIAFGYLFQQKEMGYDAFAVYREDDDPGFNKFELSWHLGLAYRILANTVVHTQFSYSMKRIRGKYDSQIPGIYAGQFNNTLMLGLQIYLGRSGRS